MQQSVRTDVRIQSAVDTHSGRGVPARRYGCDRRQLWHGHGRVTRCALAAAQLTVLVRAPSHPTPHIVSKTPKHPNSAAED